MSEMAERVEAAIRDAIWPNDYESAFWREELARAARSAIAAMREPTEYMLAAVIERPIALIVERTAQGCIEYATHMDAGVAAERLALRQRWEGMIDAALADETMTAPTPAKSAT